MKMGTALFWGLLLILIGLSLIFRIIFNIDFPLFKIIIAFLFIFIGIRILIGSTGFVTFHGKAGNAVFSEQKYKVASGGREYNVIFGSGVYDFRDFDPSKGTKSVKISSVFGSAEILINIDTPVRIRVEAVFAGVNLPNGNSAVFGNSTYESPNFNPDLPYLEINLDAVFGGINVKTY
jgi:predicted membrane protein